MSFFDDLKKPMVKAEPQPVQFIINVIERERLVNELWCSIRSECQAAKNSGKRIYRANYLGYIQYTGGAIYTEYPERGGTFKGPGHRRIVFIHDSRLSLVRSSGGTEVLNFSTSLPDSDATYGYSNISWNSVERDKVLQLLREKLIEDGFPADAVRPHEYGYGGEGSGFIRRNRKTVPTIKVEVNW